jgi:ectoine hydroxylase-related dioxygenase (phytanoyl-CoA dioxygenase family)
MIDMGQLRSTMARDGVACLRDFLSPDQLADAVAAYEWTRDNRGPGFTTISGDQRSWQDLSNPVSYASYAPMLSRSPIPALLRALWDGPVWYMYEQIFHKEATDLLTAWHQDTPYLPIAGNHLAVFWISLEPVEREATLEYCLGSHRGPIYNGTTFMRDDPTDPFYKTGNLPRLPDIEADRGRWTIGGWATEPGDVVMFHPSVLHGGGSPGPQGRRRTLTLRFFGEDATYASRPGPTAAPRVAGLHDRLRDGDPFRDPVFPQLA